jgi:hypothetical protein
MRKEQVFQQAVAQNVPVPKAASPDFRAEAEMIVQEEREAKGKLPTYKGLENFRLLDKMGECVIRHILVETSVDIVLSLQRRILKRLQSV